MPKDPSSFPFFVIGNKNDMIDQREVPQDAVDKYLKSVPDTKYFETSASTGTNVE